MTLLKFFSRIFSQKTLYNPLISFKIPIKSTSEITQAHIPKLFELHENEDEESEIVSLIFYKPTKPRFLLYFSLSLLSFGFFYLLCRWNLSLKLSILYRKCLYESANYLLITLSDKRRFFLKISNKKLQNSYSNIPQDFRTFEYKLYRYYFNPELKAFRLIRFPLQTLSNTYIHENLSKGLPVKEIPEAFKRFYGSNSTEISETPITKIISDELTSPYFVFPILSCIIWFLEYYQIYAAIILAFTLISVFMSILVESNNMKKLQTMSYFKIMLNIYRGIPKTDFLKETFQDLFSYRQSISSLELLPGDIIEIPENTIMPADIVLLNGTCIMNEMMLTGESLPVKKISLPYDDQQFSPRDENKASMLFSGTLCLESRYYKKDKVPVLGLVYDTGFNAMKGQLLRSILFPKANSFNFNRDSFKFILAMMMISLIGLAVTIYNYHKYGSTAEELVFACLDMITVVIPPALPTCMSFGIAFAILRLRKKRIYCISPEKIIIAGKLDIICFDKTGTLTKEGLVFDGVIPIKSQDSKIPCFGAFTAIYELNKAVEIRSALLNSLSMNMETSLFKQTRKNLEAIFIEVLACCHSLTRVNKKLIGDLLDITMFESTGWQLEENYENYDDFLLGVVTPPQKQPVAKTDFQKVKQNLESETLQGNPQIGIIKRFEFSSRLQRMSVIVKNMNEVRFRVHVKGAPEKLRELCKVQSIPKNFHETLDKYSREGKRVLACASRALKTSMKLIRNLEREDVEKELVFLGFLIMESHIKNVTKDVIGQLHEANIRTIMVTGDNILTAISVARQCNLVPARQQLYYAEVNIDKTKNKSEILGIKWLDFDCFENILNPKSLKREDKSFGDNQMMSSENNETENNVNIANIGNNFKDIPSFQTNDELNPLKTPSVFKKSHFLLNKDKINSVGMTININNSLKKIEPSPVIEEKIKKNTVSKSACLKSPIANLRNYSINMSPNIQTIMKATQPQHSFLYRSSQIYKFIMQGPLINQSEIKKPWSSLNSANYSLAISGQVFSYLLKAKKHNKNYKKMFENMLEKAQIFARMKPREKALLIQELQNKYKDSLIGMCGDGPNDCAALSTADIGVSLNDAEASIAATFTSKTHDISCVLQLLRFFWQKNQ